LKEFRNKEKKEKVIELVENILAIKEENERNLNESRRRIQEEKEIRQQNKERFYMLGNRAFSETEFDKLDEKAKERLKPYLELITQRMAKYLLKEKYEEEQVQFWQKEKEMEEEYNARYS
jgi:lipopolysaccharide export LptBFGC system permease protein LptF